MSQILYYGMYLTGFFTSYIIILMVIEEFAQVLVYLEIDPKVIGWSKSNSEAIGDLLKELKELCYIESSLPEVIWKLDNEYNKTKKLKQYSLNLPFYSIMISYAYHAIPDWPWAIKYAERALKQFSTLEQIRNKAICSWFLGLLFYASRQYESAKDSIKNARDEILSLEEVDNKEFVKKIDQTYSKLQILVQEEKIQLNDPKASIEDFSWLISNLDFFEEDILYHDLKEILEDLKILNSDNIGLNKIYVKDLLKHLSRISQELIEDGYKKTPFINFFLAHCYTLSYFGENRKNIYLAIQELNNSVYGFQEQGFIYNQAISSLYLALLYFNLNNRNDSSLKMTEANYLLLEIDQVEEQDPDFSNKIDNLKNYLAEWIDILKKRPKSTNIRPNLIQKSLDYFKKIFEQFIPSTLEVNENSDFKSYLQDSKLPNYFSRPISINDFDQPLDEDSAPTNVPPPPIEFPENELVETPDAPHQGQLLEPENETVPSSEIPKPPQSDSGDEKPLHITIPVDLKAITDPNCRSNPIEQNFFDYLKEFNQRVANANQKAPENPMQTGTYTNNSVGEIAPSFPIYGYATAGPQGKPVLPPAEDFGLEKASEVDKDSIVIINEEIFKVYSIEGWALNGLPKRSKKYGWCRVEGNSMNNTSPISIENGDYVLFNYDTRNLEFCNKKIVVATLQSIESTSENLIVKLLRKFISDEDKAKKYFLKSDSLYEMDADGLAFEDIEVKEDHQIVGTVIAIAKPI